MHRHLKRAIVAASWLGLLVIFFRWWDITLRFDRVLVWTAVFCLAFLGTASVIRGPRVHEWGRAVWIRPVVWFTLIPVVFLAAVLFPAIHVRDNILQSAGWVGVLDVVFPFWITGSAAFLLWESTLIRVLIAVGVLPVLFLFIWTYMVQMPGTSYTEALAPLSAAEEESRQRLEKHVHVLAGDIGERNYVEYAELEEAARYIERNLAEIGYDVVSLPYEIRGRTFRNLEATLEGTNRPDEILIVGGHYDSVEGAPGANDNATGVAAVLELARTFANERFARTIRFVAFVNEEPPHFLTGTMGSRVYADQAASRGDDVAAMMSLETIGYYSTAPGSQQYPFPFSLFYPNRGDFIGFVANLGSRRLVRRSIATFRREARFPSQGVAAPSWIPGINWSDQASFWAHGYPAIMITDTAPFRYPFYHTSQDTPDKVDYEGLARVVAGIASVVRALAGSRG